MKGIIDHERPLEPPDIGVDYDGQPEIVEDMTALQILEALRQSTQVRGATGDFVGWDFVLSEEEALAWLKTWRQG